MITSTDPLRLLLVCLCVVQQCAALHVVLVVDQHRVRGRPLRVRGVPLHENGTPVYSCQENMIKKKYKTVISYVILNQLPKYSVHLYCASVNNRGLGCKERI